MSDGSFRLRRPSQIAAVSVLRKLTIMNHYNAERYALQPCGSFAMPKIVEHVHWPDAPDLWMPYAPAIKVKGGTTVYLAGVTAAPVYHHHPHRPEEFDN